MDLLKVLEEKISNLPQGPHTEGLQAVLVHMKCAFRHISRGDEQGDETAFTDAIYRCNQAFEGGIKEAYRVLAQKDPSKKRPYDIEDYLQESKVFRSRILTQFTNYRQEWRNPSTHEYSLFFNEDEAILAASSVATFCILLSDQIAEKLSFLASRSDAEASKDTVQAQVPSIGGIQSRVAQAIHEFVRQSQAGLHGSAFKTEVQVIGALSGFLSSAAPDLNVSVEHRLTPVSRERADLLISDDKESIIVELKKDVGRRQAEEIGALQISTYMDISGIRKGLLFIWSDRASSYKDVKYAGYGSSGNIIVIKPDREAE